MEPGEGGGGAPAGASRTPEGLVVGVAAAALALVALLAGVAGVVKRRRRKQRHILSGELVGRQLSMAEPRGVPDLSWCLR